ncbi:MULTISPECIES: hypothetical protein [Dehalococcoides]|uniref:Uncharacterized protein n=1 Tax=Dehalococcoides mccartyi TaxID=61435 RepID=A0AB38Z9J1_9CHLR|nr:hypothetical protein [Dehalococcoides mccartyi]WRO07250.1 hypothetical protein VLL09_07655 [Dehalococcoides mccartyi]
MNMVTEYIIKDEIEKERTPSELQSWLSQKVENICSTQEGLKAFRLQKGLLKKLTEEISPLAKFGEHKFGNTNQVLLKPVMGNQRYDAIVIDKRTAPATKTYIEVTQAHEGKNDYWRRRELFNKSYSFAKAPVIKTGKGKNIQVSIPPEATPVEEGVENELKRIVVAAEKKAGKDYPTNTSLIISFDDAELSEKRLEELSYPTIDDFVKKELLPLDLRFSHLYLAGKANKVFREYLITKQV